MTDITTMILEGEADHALDELADAIRQRKNTLSQIKFAGLQKDDKVRIVNCRPRYLNGAIGVIEEKRITKIAVRFPADLGMHDPYDKWAGKIGIFPPNLIEKVEKEG